MTKAELIKAFKESTDFSSAEASQYIDQLGDIMASELLAGGEVPIPGIGKLKVKNTAARTARNPRTGETINVPAGRKVVFVPGKEFKESL